MSHTLGIDIGTYASKGVIVDGDGQIIAQAERPHEMIIPQPGWAEHRPDEDWWGDFCFLSNTLLEKSGIDPSDIKAVACSAIGPCMLPVDEDGEALMNGVLYGVDNRAAAEVEELTEEIGEDVLLARCGNALTSQSVGPKILWLKRNRPHLFEQMDKIHTSTTYMVRKLTGRTVIDHYTAANFSPLYDVELQGWTTDLADHIVDEASLPEILWSNEIAGEVTAQAAAQTGLAAGTSVLTGTIDAAAEAISVGVMAPGQMMMMYGSTIFIIMPTAQRVSDSRLWYAPWLFEGQHACMAGLATSGTLTHWFRDRFALELDRDTAFATLAEEAQQSPPGANGLIMLPYFSGERTPIHDPLAKGTLFGLNLTHSRGDIYRAMLEGIALGTGDVIDTYRDAGAAPQSLHAVGGGVKNRVWSQATSDICGMPQVVREKSIGASFGNAFLAATAIGSATMADIDAWNPVVETIDPDATTAGLYAERLSQFRSLYENTKDLMHALG
ncbi:MAG: FGGY-family carbohydrate kinase [Ahrensia sp.]|nr:FGGY-family carbohydrate kinase [Ahrensia sp.]